MFLISLVSAYQYNSATDSGGGTKYYYQNITNILNYINQSSYYNYTTTTYVNETYWFNTTETDPIFTAQNQTIWDAINAISGGDANWNKTYADTLYADINLNQTDLALDYVDLAYISKTYLNQFILDNNASWLSTFNTTYAETTNSWNGNFSLFVGKGNETHTHDASNITTGTLALARLPVLNDTHTHQLTNITINQNLNMGSKNITFNNNSFMCWAENCQSYITYNGSSMIIKVI